MNEQYFYVRKLGLGKKVGLRLIGWFSSCVSDLDWVGSWISLILFIQIVVEKNGAMVIAVKA